MRKFLYILIIISILTSCNKEDITSCHLRSGNTATEIRNIEYFRNIQLRDNINLILEQSDTSYISITTGKNLIEGIKTEVTGNGWLIVENKNGCDWARDYDVKIDVHVYLKDIDTIEYRSIGDIISKDTIESDTMWIHAYEGAGVIKPTIKVERFYCQLHYGTMDFIIDGRCGMAVAYSASYGLMDLRNLVSKIVYVNSRSSNNTFVHAYITLGAEIGNIGDIYYSGDPPDISFNKTGSGDLIKLPD